MAGGLQDLGPAPLQIHWMTLSKTLLSCRPQSPPLYSRRLRAGSQTAWIQIWTPPLRELCDFGKVTKPPRLQFLHP